MQIKTLTLLFLSSLVSVAHSAEFDHTHQLYGKVLKKVLKEGLVNYPDLKADPKDLDSYLAQLAAVKEDDFNQWPSSQKLAYLTNLYNAQTLRLILDNYPVKSIKDIGGVLKGPWKQPVVRLFGKMITLDELEHGILRKDYTEPRLHFALVCAALGCPPLREEPYVPAKLEQQLEDQGKKFLASKNKNSLDQAEKVLNLSPIFKWFAEDFVHKSGTVLAFVQSYFPPDVTRELLKGNYKINYTFYDWSLNDQATQKK